MAKKMKDYKIFGCPYCACEYYDETAKKGKRVGNPLVYCPNCARETFRDSVFEAALISEKKFFDIRFASLYAKLRIALILLYAVFFVLILLTKDMMLAVCLVAAAVMLYILYEAVRIAHRHIFVKSDEYNDEITQSLSRMADEKYAAAIIKAQGLDEDSVYYYELYKEEDE